MTVIVSRSSSARSTRYLSVLPLLVFGVVNVLLSQSSPSIVGTVDALQLNPSTPPEAVIERQLEALRDGDIGTVYKFASPGNKEGSGDVTNFARMVQSGPYRYLVGHSRSDILIESKMAASRQFLVRVTAAAAAATTKASLDLDDDDGDDEDAFPTSKDTKCAKVIEYWWSLSRCNSGEFSGSYMVDAVIPNKL